MGTTLGAATHVRFMNIPAVRFAWLIPLSVLGGFAIARWTNASPSDSPSRWVRVVSDSNYSIAIDTSRIRRRSNDWFDVWYRTDHTTTHLHNGKPFNREIVQSFLRCDKLWFKVASVDMSLGTHRPIARQRTEPGELAQQPWRHVERGTVEEVAARAACQFAQGRREQRRGQSRKVPP